MKIKLVAGLGNPGKEYQRTYHNAGALFVDYLEKKFSLAGGRQPVILAKPPTFMNESGRAVAASLKYFKVKPEEALVAHDDSDIELGEYKLSFGRGAGGHRGVESVIKELKTKNFWRLRIGIRRGAARRGAGRKKAAAIVLKKMAPAELAAVKKSFQDSWREIFKDETA